MFSPRYQQRRTRTPIERILLQFHRGSAYGAGIATIGFAGYLALGYAVSAFSVFTPAYPFASFEDPVFLTIALVLGVLLAISTGTLTLLTLLTGTDDSNAEFVILVSMIGFGFSTALLRVTFKPFLTLLSHGIPPWMYL